MQLFYAPDLDQQTHYQLTEEESTHCIKVLRMKLGNTLTLTNGFGVFFTGKIIAEHAKHTTLEIIDKTYVQVPRNYKLHLAVAPTKNIARFEWFLEKATEIGVDRITPLICHYSERVHLRHDRLERIVIAAAKQSLSAYMPHLDEPMSFKTLLSSCSASQQFIAYVDENHQKELKHAIVPGKDVLILIGPEGDFSPDEISEALSHGYEPVGLGKSRLRTETAGLAACMTVSIMNDL
jgi:16S rRNA (uracil1498-N3)-methyltransferase